MELEEYWRNNAYKVERNISSRYTEVYSMHAIRLYPFALKIIPSSLKGWKFSNLKIFQSSILLPLEYSCDIVQHISSKSRITDKAMITVKCLSEICTNEVGILSTLSISKPDVKTTAGSDPVTGLEFHFADNIYTHHASQLSLRIIE